MAIQTIFRPLALLALAALGACGGGGADTTTVPPGGSGNPGMLALAQASYSVAQSAGTVTLNVSRSGGSSGAVSVAYATANGTASAGTHYTSKSGTLNWADGDAADKSITITLSGTAFSGNKDFTVTLSGPTGSATLGTPASATVTVGGSASPGTLALAQASYAVAQSAGTVTLTATRTGGSSGAVTLAYATSDGTATAGTHYSGKSGTLSWADGDVAAKAITVTLSSTAFTGSKAFTVTVSGPTGSATLGTPASATVTITGSGTAPSPGTLALAQANYAASQASGSATLTVNRTGGTSGAVTVAYATADGTATAGTHYTSKSGTLSWADGDAAAKTITVALSATAFTGSKAFTVTISGPTGSATLGSPATATVTIAGSGSSGNLAIHVSGNHFVNGSGATVQLRGVNVSGLEFVAIGGWSPANPWGVNQPNYNAILSWGANAIRVPLHEQSWLGLQCIKDSTKPTVFTNPDPGANYQATVIKAVADATAAGLYVILDLHWGAPDWQGVTLCATDQPPMANADHSLAFWTSIANTFKNNPAVIFELFNEPYVGESLRNDNNPAGQDIAYGTSLQGDFWVNGVELKYTWHIAGMQAMLDAVRATGATNPVLVGTDNWTQQMTDWLKYPVTDGQHQLGAAWHPYPATSQNLPTQVLCIGLPGCSAQMMQAVKDIMTAGYPVVATEYGDNVTASPGVNSPWGAVILPFSDTNGISYMAWTWNNFSPNAANWLIKDSTGTPSNGFGEYVKQHYLCRAAGTASCP